MADVSGRELAEYMEVDLRSLILSSSNDFSSFWRSLTTLSTGAALRSILNEFVKCGSKDEKCELIEW